MKIKIVIVVVFLAGLNLKVQAQQDIQYTQYMYNTVAINPAYAGSRGMLSFNALYRSQWTGLDGAPETINFTGHSPLKMRGVGVGLSLASDKIGPATESLAAADFSYTIHMSYRTKLSFGLKAGLHSLGIDSDRFDPDQQNDPYIYNQDNRIAPLIGAGIYLHSDAWYVGLSSPDLLETDHYDDVSVSIAREKMHLYLMGGYVFDLNPQLKFKPATLVKAVAGAPLAVDLSANFLFHEKLTLGAAYRIDAAVSALVGLQVFDWMMIGYAHDRDTSGIGNYNNGSHEVFFRFELNSRSQGSVHPRFF
ncbi:type IX secretion system membrane protein, PorP/SprF family [Flagellimonas taeanensis]|uniref:Type IX secretion system membrane protein, PorP/SprF family n=1 Tax=Flagellimonas taeanensis TaxID=1005926 RepID=A0A1M6SC74_9FLAO|nr:type IX secretion system membrane protein PorP/SprF [Allomuricauda taeanensis]SFB79902.1 type IX secretion system membrane protein, PorP/SprF family [Allomuricauda taeanensis]SHK42353.1 type IX secretion system membrane protein, PorP/SprF family [Allomuricauda taeanensis]